MFQNALHLTCPDFLREMYEYFVALKIKPIPDLKTAITTQCNSEHYPKGFHADEAQGDKTALIVTNHYRTLCSHAFVSYAVQESCAKPSLCKGTVL